MISLGSRDAETSIRPSAGARPAPLEVAEQFPTPSRVTYAELTGPVLRALVSERVQLSTRDSSSRRAQAAVQVTRVKGARV